MSLAASSSILEHLPPEVKQELSDHPYDVVEFAPKFGWMGPRKIVIYPSKTAMVPQNEGTVVAVYTSNSNVKKSFAEFPFRDKICTHTAYKLYTKASKSLPSETVNAIYLACLKEMIARPETSSKEIPLSGAILGLISSNSIKKSDIDMEFLMRSKAET